MKQLCYAGSVNNGNKETIGIFSINNKNFYCLRPNWLKINHLRQPVNNNFSTFSAFGEKQ